ncbi:hypothetical protein PV325_007782 [Microctonus aethiopoides]|uniref:PDZ GRASP-type domain-containing protein n=1 Tax=Microctonus aethiopoides TaxID=144406 RepID=A0AA39KRD5_9HYME|nr:hypothetical protein PV325_007782 [Microctonus aethiopoides]KAK0097745.1 hypothetical protein PV326_014048 [Microctonus aethiopoides]KAK0171083.1 hypothetical protein PV328_008845 [Microctonus aethiopoides]
MGSSHSIEVPGGGTEGYHVLRVQDGSPGQKAGLEAFFDFIVSIGNVRLDQDNDTLKDILKSNIDKVLQVTVYSRKTQSVRNTIIVPSMTWGGNGLLGVSIRFCSFESANENVWHVLEVHPSSPAELAGLRSFTDYIVSTDSPLHGSEDLFTQIEAHESRPLKLYVYNTNEDSCREVTITPCSKWGGEGSLGCGIGYGYLHRIPIRNLPETKPVHQNPYQPTSTKTPIAAQTSPVNYQITNNQIITTVPPGFSIPPSYITTVSEAPKHTDPTVVSSVPMIPSTASSISALQSTQPVVADNTSQETNSAAHLFSQPNSNYPPSYDQLQHHNIPSIPGMPTAPPVQPFLIDTSIPITSTNLQQSFNPSTTAPTPLPTNLSQPHIVTTPITLPGMPPITVSASLPQNSPYYPPLLDQNQLAGATNISQTTSPTAP